MLEENISESIKLKIQKLLALGDATQNTNVNEVNTALARAKSLLEKYNLSLSDVLAKDNEVASTDSVNFTPKYGKIEQYEWILVSAINSIYDTFSYLSGSRIIFVGLKTNVTASSLTFEYLKQSIKILELVEGFGGRRFDKVAFRQGVADTILATVRKNTQSTGSIIRLSNELIKKYKENIHLNSAKTSSNNIRSNEDYLKGREVGKSINPTGTHQHIY